MTGGGWLESAEAGLAEGHVYVSPQVRDADGLADAVTSVLPDDGSIAVAVLPQDARLEAAYSTYHLDRLSESSGAETLVVAVGPDLQADSTAIDGDEAMRIANEAESAAGGDVEAALTETVEHLSAELPASEGAPDTGAAAGGGWVLPVVLIAAVVVAVPSAVAGAVVLRRRRRKRPAAEEQGPQLPETIRELLDGITARRRDYAAGGRDGDLTAAQVDKELERIVWNIRQLFARLDAKAGAQQRMLAEVEYEEKLGHLRAAVERDYLLDLLVHPELWDDPARRVAEVREALRAVGAQLVENIKQVNADRALEFEVTLDSLIGRDDLPGPGGSGGSGGPGRSGGPGSGC